MGAMYWHVLQKQAQRKRGPVEEEGETCPRKSFGESGQWKTLRRSLLHGEAEGREGKKDGRGEEQSLTNCCQKLFLFKKFFYQLLSRDFSINFYSRDFGIFSLIRQALIRQALIQVLPKKAFARYKILKKNTKN